MAAQDYAGPVRWLIVDDGAEPQPVTFGRDGWSLEVIRPTPHWRPGQNTQARNLLAGLARCCAQDRVVVVEDDDYYAPDWISHVAGQLEVAELVGETCARYYNLRTRRGRQLQNAEHSSLCSTALRGRAIDGLRKVCQGHDKFIDMTLWQRWPDKHLFDGHRVVGIKGLPGRSGIGVGHRPWFRGTHDRKGHLLRTWLGNDAEAYL